MAADSNPLRDRILKTLGQQGALSMKGIVTILRPQEPKTIETELKTMVRRKLVEEPFIGSFELTKTGRKHYDELVKHVPRPVPGRGGPWPNPTGLDGIPLYDIHTKGSVHSHVTEEGATLFNLNGDEGDDEEEDEEYCEDCDWPIDQCHCDDEEEDDDDDDDDAY